MVEAQKISKTNTDQQVNPSSPLLDGNKITSFWVCASVYTNYIVSYHA